MDLMVIRILLIQFLLFPLACVLAKPDFFLIGLPRAGTTSFHDLFLRLRLKSAYYTGSQGLISDLIFNAKKEGLPMMHSLQHYHAISKMDHNTPNENYKCYYPQIEDLERLYEENKNATFILNYRELDTHFDSLSKTEVGLNILRHCRHFLNFGGLKQLIKTHNARVRKFFAERPEAKFVEFHIEHANMSVLAPYLDTKGLKFPKWNARKKSQYYRKQNEDDNENDIEHEHENEND